MNLRNHFLSPIEKGRYGAPGVGDGRFARLLSWRNTEVIGFVCA
jgi:hypothetical protein